MASGGFLCLLMAFIGFERLLLAFGGCYAPISRKTKEGRKDAVASGVQVASYKSCEAKRFM